MSSESISAATLNDRAIALFESGDWDGADWAWYQARSLDPEHWETLLNVMLAAWRQGHTTDRVAVTSFENRRAAQNDAWPTVYALGLIHLERRDLVQAVPLLEEAARRSAQDLGFEPLLRHAREAGGVERVAELKIDPPPSSTLPIALARDALVVLVGEGHDVVLRRAHDLSELARLSGATGPVTALAVTSDGRVGVSGGEDARVSVWDLSSRQRRRVLGAPDLGPVLSLALSADGGRAVAVSLDPVYAEKVWPDVEAWRRENPGRSGPMVAIRKHCVVHLWDLESGDGDLVERDADGAHLVRSTADGAHALLIGDQDPWARLLHFASGTIEAVAADQVLGPVLGVAPSSVRVPSVVIDGRFAAARDGRRAAWGQPMGPVGECVDPVYSLVVHDTMGGRRLHTMGLEHLVHALQMSADGTLVVTSSRDDGIVQTWRLPERWDPLVPFQSSRPARVTPSTSSSATELRARAEGACACRNFQGALEALSILRQLPGHERTEESCEAWARLYRVCTRTGLRSTWIVRTFDAPALFCLAHDGSAIASAAGGAPTAFALEDAHGDVGPTAFKLEDVRSRRRLLHLEGTIDRPASLDFSANMRFLAAGGDATIAVWDLDTGRVRVHPVRDAGPITGLRIGNDGRHARFTTRTGPMVWDGSEIPRPGTDPLFASLAREDGDPCVTADGRWRFEAVPTRDRFEVHPGPLYLVDRAEGTRRVLVPACVFSAQVSRDGRWLLTVESSFGFSHTVRVQFLDWDLAAPGPGAIELDPPRAFPGARPTRPSSGEPRPDLDAAERRAMIDFIAASARRSPGTCDENTHLGALCDSFGILLYVVGRIESEYGVALARDNFLRAATVGDLVDLVGRTLKG